jgi:hypothetical protein
MRLLKGFITINKRVYLTDNPRQVTKMTISLDELGLTNPECASDFAQSCLFSNSMTIRISTDVLWSSDDPAEQSYDWLAVLMFGEFLASLGTKPSYDIVKVNNRVMAVDFTLNRKITAPTIISVMNYGAALLAFQTDGSATCYFDSTDIIDYETAFFAFQTDIINRVQTFDSLAVKYAESYIAGQQANATAPDEHATTLDRWINLKISNRNTA